MDTKLKKFSHSLILKTIAFTLIILFLSGIMYGAYVNEVGFQGKKIELDTAGEKDYFESDRYHLLISDIVHITSRLTNDFKSESYIKNGERLADYLESHKVKQMYRDFQKNSDLYDEQLTNEKNYERFKSEYSDQIEKFVNESIKNDLETYNNLVEKLEDYQMDYYINTGERLLTNMSLLTSSIKEDFKNKRSYFLIDEKNVTIEPSSVLNNKEFEMLKYNVQNLSQPNVSVYFGFNKDFLVKEIDEWKFEKSQAEKIMKYLLILTILGIISLIYLMIVVGKGNQKNEYSLNFTDKIYTDVKISLVICLSLLLIPIFNISHTQNLIEWFWVSFVIVSIMDLGLFLSLIKHLKRHNFIRYSLTFTIIKKIFSGLKNSFASIINSKSMGIKAILLILTYTFVIVFLNLAFRFNESIVILGTLFIMFLLTLFILKKVRQFYKIKNGVKMIRKGNLSHEINISGNGELSVLGENINQISDGLSNAIENEMKNERLKTELITNVSHDIRTPLTSIITYVDLLKKEKDKNKMKEYIRILEKKSERLNRLIDDLFDASKINSGQIEAKEEQVNILELINQAEGEMENKIKKSNLTFRINSIEKPIVLGDGQLLWRVIENLFSNVIKYSLNGSRVYIDIYEEGNCIAFEIKNISKKALNINSDELFERFIRGDDSRTTEGNGLGLSIAKSLITLQEGTLDIEIDGDLFKVIVKLPKIDQMD